MSVRNWGGWLLVVLGIGILMTIGCEKGELGVKSGLVRGVLVDASRPAVRIAGARVVLVSTSSTSGAGSSLPNGQFLVTTTDSNGVFVFDNVRPDTLKLEATKVGYEVLQWPAGTTTTTTPTPTPTTASIRAQAAPPTPSPPGGGAGAGTTSAVSAIWVTNGSVVDVGNLGMTQTGSPISEVPILVRLIFRYRGSEGYVGDTDSITVAFDNVSFTHTAFDWRQGKDSSTGSNITLAPKSGDYLINIQPDPDKFLGGSAKASGSRDIFMTLYADPFSYDVELRPINVPATIATGSVMRVFAETILSGTATTTKIMAETAIFNLNTAALDAPPTTLEGVFLPANLRLRMTGYTDKLVHLSKDKLPPGTAGIIPMDINFSLNDQGIVEHMPDANGVFQIGMLGNRITRTVTLKVTGPDFKSTDWAYAYLWGPPTASAPGPDATFNFLNVPVGFSSNYNVVVNPSAFPALASGSFTASGPITVPVETETNQSPFIVFVNAIRPAAGS